MCHYSRERIVDIESQPAPPDLRTRFLDDDYLANLARYAPAGLRLRTPAELEDSLQAILRRHSTGQDLHMICYGSLMWNPVLEHAGQARATIHGRHRSFCLRNIIGRGTPERPGMMLALDRGGSCSGTLLRLLGLKVESELRLLWRREMAWGSYDARCVRDWTGGVPVQAVTFVVRRGHERYLPGLSLEETTRLINTGAGSLGTCRAYFDATLDKLRELSSRDRRMERLDAALRGRPAGPVSTPAFGIPPTNV